MLTEIPSFPLPEGAIGGTLERGGGISLRYALWPSTATEPTGTVCLFGGRTEFIEKYGEVVADLRDRGFAVATMDWRGQGLSTREIRSKKGHIDDFSVYEADVDAFLTAIVLPECPPPFFALAHSMGAHVLLRYARRGANPIDRMVLSAPMIEIGNKWLGTSAINTVTEIASLFGLGMLGVGRTVKAGAFDGNPLTRDRARFDRAHAYIAANPGLAVGPPTVGWLHAATESAALLLDPAFAGSVGVPVLIVVGSADTVVSVRACEALGRRLKAGRTLVIPGARHELLMEIDPVREAFFAAFDAFIPGEERRRTDSLAIG